MNAAKHAVSLLFQGLRWKEAIQQATAAAQTTVQVSEVAACIEIISR